MLTDLRKINSIIEPMGALQLDIPSPSMIPQNWKIKIINLFFFIISLQDCFYIIHLQASDAIHFTFTILPINNKKKKQCLNITGRYCHKEYLIVLHYVNYMSQ